MYQLLVVGLLALPGTAWTQDSVRLRFTPVLGAKVHRVFQTHTRMVVPTSGSIGEGVSRRETVDLGGVVQVVVAGPGGEPVVHLAFDSLRTRLRRVRGESSFGRASTVCGCRRGQIGSSGLGG